MVGSALPHAGSQVLLGVLDSFDVMAGNFLGCQAHCSLTWLGADAYGLKLIAGYLQLHSELGPSCSASFVLCAPAQTLWPAAGTVPSDYASSSATLDPKATPPAAARLPPSRFGSSILEDVAEGEELRRR